MIFSLPHILGFVFKKQKQLLKENISILEKLDNQVETIKRLKEMNDSLQHKNTALVKKINSKNTEIVNLKKSVNYENSMQQAPFSNPKHF